MSAVLTQKDFATEQEVRWCPGCGDNAILAQVQKTLPEIGMPRENIVFISGIGCSSRFPYYVNTYGIHTIHGRAPTVAMGLKCARPELQVWVVTGDGDALAIGGNHFSHALRRNVDINILLFNNRIYGLTKGQYSPTTPPGIRTLSSPDGSIENPVNPVGVAIGSEAGFIARTVDVFQKHMAGVLRRAAGRIGKMFTSRGPGFRRLAQAHAGNTAGDTLVAMALAGTLFFSVPSTEARENVALYLLITLAPFAVIGPFLGSFFARFPSAYRGGLLVSSALRALVCIVMALWLDSFLLFPLAFALLALSRFHGISRSS